MAEIREKIRASKFYFEDVLANPALFEDNNPTLTCEEIVELLESFYLLQPLEEKWG